ncbi:MAG: DUF4190 domain-containing protein [Burkholderiales bacterium]|nr:DUF4190 domain-containing protein [Opitutaceae bacterium]
MQCKNHSAVAAADRCTGCAEPFCPDCLVEIHGQKYCGDCKIMALKGAPLLVEEGTIPCKEAGEALTYGIISLFCFGFITGPVAISKAMKARELIASDPQLTGSGKATAGLVIGILGLVFWVLGLVMRVANIE